MGDKLVAQYYLSTRKRFEDVVKKSKNKELWRMFEIFIWDFLKRSKDVGFYSEMCYGHSHKFLEFGNWGLVCEHCGKVWLKNGVK